MSYYDLFRLNKREMQIEISDRFSIPIMQLNASDQNFLDFALVFAKDSFSPSKSHSEHSTTSKQILSNCCGPFT